MTQDPGARLLLMHSTRLRLAAATVSLGLVPALLSITGAVARSNQILEAFVTRLPNDP